MDIKKYNTDHLTFSLHKLIVPGDPTYQLVVKYDCEWIFSDMFSSEKEVGEFLEKYYELFTYKADVIQGKLYAYKQSLCRDLKENLEYVL